VTRLRATDVSEEHYYMLHAGSTLGSGFFYDDRGHVFHRNIRSLAGLQTNKKTDSVALNPQANFTD
jgi:hypothetical protein